MCLFLWRKYKIFLDELGGPTRSPFGLHTPPHTSGGHHIATLCATQHLCAASCLRRLLCLHSSSFD